MIKNDRQKKTIRTYQLQKTIEQIHQTNDPEQIRRHLGLMQLRCLDYMTWLDRLDECTE